jgi:hypothetical protein
MSKQTQTISDVAVEEKFARSHFSFSDVIALNLV